MTRPLEEVHAELQRCAATWQPGARLLGNVTALEIEMLTNELATAKRDLSEARKVIEAVEAWFALASSPRMPSSIRTLLAPPTTEKLLPCGHSMRAACDESCMTGDNREQKTK